MSGERYPVVLLPRFTTYAAPGDYPTFPVNVHKFELISVSVWQGVTVGTAGARLDFHFQESTDRDNWNDLGAVSPAAGTEQTYSYDLDKEFFRLKVSAVGQNVTGTCYVYGFLQKRQASMSRRQA